MTLHSTTNLRHWNTTTPFEGIGSVVNRTKNCMKCVYDFAVLGGAVATINLVDDEGNLAVIPDNAVIERVVVDVITQPVSSGSATVAIGANTTTDILGATAKASLPVGLLEGVPVGTVATAVKLTAARNITATIGTAALTAGKINVFVEYYVSE